MEYKQDNSLKRVYFSTKKSYTYNSTFSLYLLKGVCYWVSFIKTKSFFIFLEQKKNHYFNNKKKKEDTQ